MTALAEARTAPRVLISDDDPAVLKTLAYRCQKMGFAVDTANNGMQLLMKARKNTPDLLIVDVNMPMIDGLSASIRLLDLGNKSIEIIVVTGSSNPETIERCGSLGMYYVRKGSEFWNGIKTALSAIYPHMAATIAEHSRQAAQEDLVPQRPRVLVIDDDPAVGTFLESRLAKFGVEMLYAPNAMLGYRLACRRQPSAIVTDYEMPDGDAHYLLARLRSTPSTERIPVFVLSGKNIDEQTEMNLRCEILGHPGATRVFKKSFDVQELFGALAGFCGFESGAKQD